MQDMIACDTLAALSVRRHKFHTFTAQSGGEKPPSLQLRSLRCDICRSLASRLPQLPGVLHRRPGQYWRAGGRSQDSQAFPEANNDASQRCNRRGQRADGY